MWSLRRETPHGRLLLSSRSDIQLLSGELSPRKIGMSGLFAAKLPQGNDQERQTPAGNQQNRTSFRRNGCRTDDRLARFASGRCAVDVFGVLILTGACGDDRIEQPRNTGWTRSVIR